MTKMEMQGPEIVPEEIEDEVYERAEDGSLKKLEVPDDVCDD